MARGVALHCTYKMILWCPSVASSSFSSAKAMELIWQRRRRGRSMPVVYYTQPVYNIWFNGNALASRNPLTTIIIIIIIRYLNFISSLVAPSVLVEHHHHPQMQQQSRYCRISCRMNNNNNSIPCGWEQFPKGPYAPISNSWYSALGFELLNNIFTPLII